MASLVSAEGQPCNFPSDSISLSITSSSASCYTHGSVNSCRMTSSASAADVSASCVTMNSVSASSNSTEIRKGSDCKDCKVEDVRGSNSLGPEESSMGDSLLKHGGPDNSKNIVNEGEKWIALNPGPAVLGPHCKGGRLPAHLKSESENPASSPKAAVNVGKNENAFMKGGSSMKMFRRFMKCMMNSVAVPCDELYDPWPSFPHPFQNARVAPVTDEALGEREEDVIHQSHVIQGSKSLKLLESTRKPQLIQLPPLPASANKKTLVLDLDETLVHSSFQPVSRPDFVIPVLIENKMADVYVRKRPGVDQFMAAIAVHYEIVVFTASLKKYADPLLDLLDPKRLVSHRLYRAACCQIDGHFVKDLSALGRDLKSTLIIDNSPHSYALHPENALPIPSFIDDLSDTSLPSLVPFLLHLAASEGDIRSQIANLNNIVLHY